MTLNVDCEDEAYPHVKMGKKFFHKQYFFFSFPLSLTCIVQ